MQLSDLRTEVRYQLGVSAGDSFASDARLTAAINSALDRLAVRHNWPWLEVLTTFPTVVDQVQYALPADHRRTLEVYIESDDLDNYQRRDITRMLDYSGRPRVYTIKDGDLWLVPKPNEVLTVTHLYIRHETALSADGDTPFLPDPYNDLLVLEAATRVAIQRGDYEKADALREERMEWLANLRDEVRRSQGAKRTRARQDWRI